MKVLCFSALVLGSVTLAQRSAPQVMVPAVRPSAALTFVVKDAGGANPPIGGATVTVVQGTKPPVVVDGTNAAGEAQFSNLTPGPARITSHRSTYVDLEQTETLSAGGNSRDGYMTKTNGTQAYFNSAGHKLGMVIVERSTATSGNDTDPLKVWHSLAMLDENEKKWVAEGIAQNPSAKAVLIKDTSFAAAIQKGGG